MGIGQIKTKTHAKNSRLLYHENVSIESMNSSTCPDISPFTVGITMKLVFVVQFIFALISIVSTLATSRRTFSSILVDTGLKEHLIVCYGIQLFQSFAILCREGVFFFVFVTQPPCLATVPATLCFYLRSMPTLTVFSLPALNLMLTICRWISFFGGNYVGSRETAMRRSLTFLTLLFAFLEFYWKLAEMKIPDAMVAYCYTATPRWNVETWTAGVFEAITLCISVLLMHCYERENRAMAMYIFRLKRSFDISVNLIRRQLMSTMRLFLPYSFFHAFSFFISTIIVLIYRQVAGAVAQPWSAVFGAFAFGPAYFTMIAPWLIYWIVVKNEKSRVAKTTTLIHLEERAKAIYFDNYRSQWEYGENGSSSNSKARHPLLLTSWKKASNRVFVYAKCTRNQ